MGKHQENLWFWRHVNLKYFVVFEVICGRKFTIISGKFQWLCRGDVSFLVDELVTDLTSYVGRFGSKNTLQL